MHDDVGGLLALPIVGTLKRADAEGRSAGTEPREGLWSAQTPQVFRYRVLARALARPEAAHCTDEAQAVEALGLKPRLVTGNPANLKITYPDDSRSRPRSCPRSTAQPASRLPRRRLLRDRAA